MEGDDATTETAKRISRSGAAVVVKALEDEGVRLTFGVPGTHYVELYDALAPATFCPGQPIPREDIAVFAAGQAPRCTCAAMR